MSEEEQGEHVIMRGESFEVVDVRLPPWAQVSEPRRKHIARVMSVLLHWLREMRNEDLYFASWMEAAALHDALRDAPEEELRQLTGDTTRDAELLHGPAAAIVAEQNGVTDSSVLLAIRHHTVGCAEWDVTGRALYMADFLEPGRNFARQERAVLARAVPRDFDGVFREVLRMRLEYALREGFTLFPETVALWNAVR